MYIICLKYTRWKTFDIMLKMPHYPHCQWLSQSFENHFVYIFQIVLNVLRATHVYIKSSRLLCSEQKVVYVKCVLKHYYLYIEMYKWQWKCVRKNLTLIYEVDPRQIH